MWRTDKSEARGQGSGTSKVLVLLDDKPGHSNQALGVAEKLGLPFETIKLEYSIFSKLPNLLLGRSLIGLVRSSKFEVRSYLGKTSLIISCGRRTAPVARWLKSRIPNPESRTPKLIHIMNPEAGLSEFDLIALPQHDKARSSQFAVRSKNIFQLVTAPHRLTQEKLQTEAEKWEEKFASLKKPIIGVLVGGGTKNGKFSKNEMEKFGKFLSSLAEKNNGSLVIVTSRRTGKEAERILSSQFPVPSKEESANCELRTAYYPYNESAPNPYLATIALSDALVVTGDSVSMVSEACYSGKLVFVYSELAAVSKKHKDFLQNLKLEKIVEELTAGSAISNPETLRKPSDSAGDIAAHIKSTL